MKLCEFENCHKDASYAYNFMKPIYCKKHKKDKMKTKTHVCICGKARPIFGLESDKRPSCCKECKTNDMLDLKHTKCKCKIAIPSFGLENDKVATCCKKCRTDEMINIKDKKCICGKSIPLFGLIKDKNATCCDKCKTDQMINIISKKCKCGKVQPIFGLITDKSATCCKECKTDIMIDIKTKKCKCGKSQPQFGLITDKSATCCKLCKIDAMIDIIGKKCKCGKSQPQFGLSNDTIATCCKECKTDIMIDIKHKMCKCGKARPSYGLNNDKIPTCCIKCKTKEMTNIVTKKCKSNYLEDDKKFMCEIQGNKKYKGYCSRCYAFHFPNDPLTFQIRCKTKEIAVRDYINQNFTGFHHDKPLWISECECTHRRRIDHRKLIGNTLLCIETDENQHKYYKKKDENARYNDVMYIHGGKFIFIRFNPDKYKENGVSKNPNISTRLIELEKEINKQITRIEKEENVELLEEVFMYYDKD